MLTLQALPSPAQVLRYSRVAYMRTHAVRATCFALVICLRSCRICSLRASSSLASRDPELADIVRQVVHSGSKT